MLVYVLPERAPWKGLVRRPHIDHMRTLPREGKHELEGIIEMDNGPSMRDADKNSPAAPFKE